MSVCFTANAFRIYIVDDNTNKLAAFGQSTLATMRANDTIRAKLVNNAFSNGAVDVAIALGAPRE